ncbi:MAG: hypothetical protein KAR20_17400, partial [Candidatus Heimdallarchaeota archaeon]|nr:hypothetical protein [Candidatus Heimdallarchaeota archaeon]
MSTNILETAIKGIVKALYVNEIVSALVGSFVGRNSSGAPASGQNLGTLLYPWGEAHINDVIYKGTPVAPDVFDSSRNRIVSGAVRTTSGQPDFLRADGATNALTILATTTSLSLVINDVVVDIESDIVVTGLTVAPGANNTMTLDDAFVTPNDVSKVLLEDLSTLEFIAVGSEITDRVGFFAAMKTPNNEIFYALIETATGLSNAFRGYFFDDNGDPIPRDTLDDGEVFTLLNLGWIFIQNN